MPARPRPILYAAFSNDLVDPTHGLAGLALESAFLTAAMAPLTGPDGAWQLLIDSGTTADSLVSTFSTEQVTIFHYAGHANPEKIMLQTATGGKQIGSAEKLEDFLARQTNLRLVFLNACSTQAWAQRLVQLGVPCVIATSCPIQDVLAPKFAQAFYQAMVKASGAATASTIQQAFDSAVAGIQLTDETTLRDIDIPGDDPTPTGQPWAIYTKAPSDSASWTLAIGANDPLIGLPPLAPSYYENLPPSPYVSIQGHTAADAALFFGRNAEIAALYRWCLTSKDSPPICLFYGQSGTGKSSLLKAGLLPRLEGLVDVTFIRRTQDLNIDLEQALSGNPGQHATDEEAKAFLAQHRLVLFDQVEEAITQKPAPLPGTPAQPDELTTFLARLVQIFSLAPNLTARIILSFRKEYLAEIQNILTQATPATAPQLYQNLWLDRLDTDGIIQVVEGPTRSAALRTRYKLTIAPDLAPSIAGDLTRDSHSSIATILEIILVKLWELANAAGQPPAYTLDLYNENSANPLQDFFTQEMTAVLAAPVGLAAKDGLQLDLLYEHSTALVTSRARTLDQLKLTYPHVENLEQLLQLNIGHLLTSLDASTTALAHDALAPVIRREFELSVLPGSRARRLLENRARDWPDPSVQTPGPTRKKRGDPFDAADLYTVERGISQMRATTPVEDSLLAFSRKTLWKNRTYAAAVLLVVALIGGGVALHQRTLARKAATTALASRLAAASISVADKDPALAVLLSAAAWQSDPTPFGVRDAIFTAYESTPNILAYLHPPKPEFSLSGGLLINPAGTQVVIATMSTLNLWDIASHRLLWSVSEPESVAGLSFSPDGAQLAFIRDTKLEIWKATDHTVIAELPLGKSAGTGKTAFSRDGKYLAATICTGIQVWQLSDRQPLRHLPAECLTDNQPLVAAFSPVDSSRLAVLDGFANVELQDIRTVHKTNLNASSVGATPQGAEQSCLAFSPDGTRIAVCDGHGGVRLLNTVTHTQAGAITPPEKQRFQSVAFNLSDGASFAAETDHGEIGIWSVADGHIIQPLSSDLAAETNGATFAPDLHLAAVLLDSSEVVLIDPFRNFGASFGNTRGGKGPTAKIALSSDGQWIATGNVDGTVAMWDAHTKGFTWSFPIAYPEGYALAVTGLAFSPDNSVLAFPHEGGVASGPSADVYLLDLNKKTYRTNLTDKPIDKYDWANSLAFAPNGQLAELSSDGPVRIWDVASQKLIERTNQPKSRCAEIAFSPDGKSIVAPSQTQNACALWDLASRKTIIPALQSDVTSTVAISFASTTGPNPSTLLAITDHTGLNVWNMDSRMLVARTPGTLVGSSKEFNGVALHPGADWLVLLSSDNSIKLWDVAAASFIGKGLRPVGENAETMNAGLAISNDGKHLLVGSDQGGFQVWDWDLKPSEWPARACRIANRDLTQDEWKFYVGGTAPYRHICHNDGRGDLPKTLWQTLFHKP